MKPATACAVGLLSLWSGVAVACVCPGTPYPEVVLPLADAVFTGEVVGESELRIDALNWSTGGFRVRVDRVWKGFVPREVTVDPFAGSCTFPLEPGKKYLVVARGYGFVLSPFRTAQCSGTVELGRAEHLALLGEGHDPVQLESWVVAGLGAMALGGVLAAILRLRRNRERSGRLTGP